MAKDLIFEIGTEEMPTSAVRLGITQLREKAAKSFEQNRLGYESLKTYGTPRRLVLNVTSLAEKQTDTTFEIKGPARKAAYSDHGEPTMAAIGFAQAQGIKVEDLIVKTRENGEYVYAMRKEAGLPAIQVLPGLLLELLNSFSFPKSMRWDDDFRFSRPIRWLLALYGEKTIDFSLNGLKSSNLTYGHRWLARSPIKVKTARDYFREVEEGKVLVDQEKRAALIEQEINKVAQKAGGTVIKNQTVFDEVVDLVEYPHALLGHFPEEYLVVPRDVLATAMGSHQRYFPVEDSRKKLLPNFIIVHNGDAASGNLIRKGHERVLKARLADAQFFFQEDQKKKLEQKVEELKGVIFQAKLGTLYEKTQRLGLLAETIAKTLETDKETIKAVKRAAFLSHADLVTKMVIEFPTLQGVMGREYAKLSGEPPEVARAIFERYLPRFAGDGLPLTKVGQIISLADKLDTIVMVAVKDLRRLDLSEKTEKIELNLPTGSEDPFALRRQATGILRILIENDLSLPLRKLLRQTFTAIHQVHACPVNWRLIDEHFLPLLCDFFADRLDRLWLNKGYSYDTAEALLPLLKDRDDDLVDLNQRINILTKFRKTRHFDDLIVAFNRCNNLSNLSLGISVKLELFQEKEEKQLHQVLSETSGKVEKSLASGDYQQALMSAAALRPAVDNMFDRVLVMAEDKAVQENRVRLLNLAVDIFGKLAEFSKLVIPAEQGS